MSKISCDVIRDLLPIYIDDIASEETKKIVKEHLKECPKCQEELSILESNIDINVKISENLADAKVIRGVRKSIQRKQIIIALIAVIIAVVISLSGMKIYMDSKRPELNGNEMIASALIDMNGTPEDIMQKTVNGVEISKELDKAYISIPVNSKNMKNCHVKLLRDQEVIEDTVIPISNARYVTYCLKNLEEFEEGSYMLEFYDSKDEINQYKWFVLK